MLTKNLDNLLFIRKIAKKSYYILYSTQCLGNHEFDLKVAGLVPYLDNLTVPVLDANIDVSGEPRLQGKFNKTLVTTVGGQQIGIIGYITKDTAFISDAGIGNKRSTYTCIHRLGVFGQKRTK